MSALNERCVLKFLHALYRPNYQVLLAHTSTGKGVPQKNVNRENLQFGFKFCDRIWYSFWSHLPSAIAARNFEYLNWLSTRTCGAGRPHVGLCPAHLVFWMFCYFYRLEWELTREMKSTIHQCLQNYQNVVSYCASWLALNSSCIKIYCLNDIYAKMSYFSWVFLTLGDDKTKWVEFMILL